MTIRTTSRSVTVFALTAGVALLSAETCGEPEEPPCERCCGAEICPLGETCCDYQCVDLRLSDAHCGACGHRCEGDERCFGGDCLCHGAVCGADQSCCDPGQCTDILTDLDNCGGCGVVCEPTEFCYSGRCECLDHGFVEICVGDETCCPRIGCTDIQRDHDNCGLCDRLCGGGEDCIDGRCHCGDIVERNDWQPVCGGDGVCCGSPAACYDHDDAEACACGGVMCAGGFICCAYPAEHDDDTLVDRCVDPSRNSRHCGGCGLACPEGQVCHAGSCRCPIWAPDCDGDGRCDDLEVDPHHCGACGVGCRAGEVCDGQGSCALTCQLGLANCSGRCVNLGLDEQHCGACDDSCRSGEVCDGSATCAVSCLPWMTECDRSCVDLMSDRLNCGACGNSCGPGRICNGRGTCALSCQTGLRSCFGRCTNLTSDRHHCGACGHACPAGEICDGMGTCAVSCQVGMAECDDRCVDLSSDRDNCGDCGEACAAGQVCASGSCAFECSAERALCGGRCVDLSSDSFNCGACGAACHGTELCALGQCDGRRFRVPSLTTGPCEVRGDTAFVGGPYGPLIATADSLLYRGRDDTVVYDLIYLYTSARVVPAYETLLTDISTGTTWTLGTGGLPAVEGDAVDSLLEVDGTGWHLTGVSRDLSAGFVLTADSGLFSGWGRLAVLLPGELLHIDLASGALTSLPDRTAALPAPCVSPFYWGLLEAFDGGLYLLYVADGTNEIVRSRVSDGASAAAVRFYDLGDACGLAASDISGRWYTHISGPSQFASSTGEHTIACDATISQF